MKRMKQKIMSSRGETLVELLASVLIGSLSVGLLVTAVITAANIGRAAKKNDEAYYKSLARAEARDSGDFAPDVTPIPDGTVTVREESGVPEDIPVSYYGGDGVYSYKKVQPTTFPGGGP